MTAYELQPPGQIADVACASDATQSYALYLPSAYSTARKWPIIYFFDPGGRGRRPLELYKNLAETYGFIFAGSNNSRNFSNEQSKSVNAIWLDTHERLALDEHRTYASGFSGGARVAGAMAIGCPKCQIAGVVAHGAGYPSNKNESSDKLLYFLAVGNQDFNWPEIMNVRREREDRGLAYRVRVFSGPHQWAPAAIVEDALQWLILKSMQAGNLAADPTFVDRIYQQRQSEADAAEAAGDLLSEFDAYRSLTSDFSGLKDTSNAAPKLAALKQSGAFQNARKAERHTINEQYSLESAIAPKLRAYAEGSEPDPTALAREIIQAMGGLSNQAAHAKSESKRLIFLRAFEDMWAEGIENGQQKLAARHFERAEACFELMSQVKSQPWPFLLLAQTHVAAGKKKEALKDLQQSVQHGLEDPESLESNPELQVLKSDPEFKRLVLQLKKQ
jgi:predicted esterase